MSTINFAGKDLLESSDIYEICIENADNFYNCLSTLGEIIGDFYLFTNTKKGFLTLLGAYSFRWFKPDLEGPQMDPIVFKFKEITKIGIKGLLLLTKTFSHRRPTWHYSALAAVIDLGIDYVTMSQIQKTHTKSTGTKVTKR